MLCYFFPQVKLTTVNKAVCLVWVSGGVLASCSGEAVVIFWDFDNYSLWKFIEGNTSLEGLYRPMRIPRTHCLTHSTAGNIRSDMHLYGSPCGSQMNN